MKKVTMADVAELAGVSKSTVSAVINNKDVVAAATRRRVLQAVDELNYELKHSVPHRSIASSGKGIGYVIKESGNPYYAEALAGIQAVAHEAGYLVFVCSSEGDFATEQEIVRQFAARGIDGLIIMPILNDETDLSHIFDLKRLNVPLILLESVRGIRAGLVDTDNVQASAQAVSHLIDLGHQRIVHFAGPDYSKHSGERVEGVRRAFSESRLIFDSRSMIIPTGDSIEAGYRTALEYFSACGDDHPTGVTCYNDLVALGLIRALDELGLRVPEDVSVIGFDDIEILNYLPVSLTTVRVPKQEMGRRAAELLLKRIEEKEPGAPERIYLEAELIVRGTTSPPGAASTDGDASELEAALEQSPSKDGVTENA